VNHINRVGRRTVYVMMLCLGLAGARGAVDSPSHREPCARRGEKARQLAGLIANIAL
jgi:hypothetical protein